MAPEIPVIRLLLYPLQACFAGVMIVLITIAALIAALLYTVFVFTPAWSDLKIASRSKVVTASYIWFIVVPTFAFLLKEAGQEVRFPLGTSEIIIPLDLPFSWKLAYFGAVLFSIGGILYNFVCPPLIRNYTGFNEYEDEGRGGEFILQQVQRLMNSAVVLLPTGKAPRQLVNSALVLRRIIKDFCDVWIPDIEEKKEEAGPTVVVKMDYKPRETFLDHTADFCLVKQASEEGTFKIRKGHLADAFWLVRVVADESFPVPRWLAFRLYAVGFALYLAVLWQGFTYVWNLTF